MPASNGRQIAGTKAEHVGADSDERRLRGAGGGGHDRGPSAAIGYVKGAANGARNKIFFHATLPVDDLARAEEFYRDFLGIARHSTPVRSRDRVVFLDLGNTMVHLVLRREDTPRIDPRSVHIAIEVDDLDALYEAAKRQPGRSCRAKRSWSGRTSGVSSSSTRTTTGSS